MTMSLESAFQDAVSRKDIDALLRLDFHAFTQKAASTLSPALTFMPNWHLEAITYALEQCRKGTIKRLIITIPPRSLKSVCASVAFPAYVLGHEPWRKIVCVSYSQELAGTMARDCREIMASAWYKGAFKTRLDRRRTAEMDFMTTQRGFRLATSPGGTLTGRGGSLIIIDDPMKADDASSDVKRENMIQWFRETLITRLDDKRNDVIIIVMQRLHIDDLVGHVLQTGEWHHLNLPAVAERDEAIPIGAGRFYYRKAGELLHPAREPQQILDELHRSLGHRAFAAQYQQAPEAPDGDIIRWSWFRWFERSTLDYQKGDQIVQSWDTASKTGLGNDYSVCTTWLVRDKQYYLVDLYRDRLEFPALTRKAVQHARDFKADYVLVEDASSGQGLLQAFKEVRGKGFEVVPMLFDRDKIARAEAQSLPIENGQVHLPNGADWLAALRSEITTFPRGHDDQVDSITQFLSWVRTRKVYAKELKIRWVTG